MMGPLGMLFKTLAKTGGKAVQKDIRATDSILAKQHFAKFKSEFSTYHAKKLDDLVTHDSGVSASWIKELIEDSRSTEQLGKVLRYMRNESKTVNLTPGTKRELLREVTHKIELLRDKEMIMKMAAFIKDHGGDLF